MQRIRTSEAPTLVGATINLCGWVHAVRRLGSVSFLILRDGWGLFQIVVEHQPGMPELPGPECIISVRGRVAANPTAPGGAELHAPEITLLSEAEAPAISLGKRHLACGVPTLLDQAVVLNRHPERRALLRLASVAMQAFRAALTERHFTEIQTPKLVGSATEGGSEVFTVDYFGQPAFLAQSPQFYKQIMVGVFERVFEVGPVFRAEPHDTVRHLSEYVSMDVELGFIEDHRTVMVVLREVLAGIIGQFAASCTAEISMLEIRLPAVPEVIPAIHFTEAKEIAWSRTGVDERNEIDLAPAEERVLGAWAQETHSSDFLFVTGYPMAKRPFYTHPDPERPMWSNSFDLLFRGLELVTGGQRLHRHADYVAALAARGLRPDAFASYLDAFRHGMPPHGGFAIGLERLIMQLTGVPNIRLAAAFPRDMRRLAP